MRQLACRIPLGVVKVRCKYRFWPASLLYDWALSLNALGQSVLFFYLTKKPYFTTATKYLLVLQNTSGLVMVSTYSLLASLSNE